MADTHTTTETNNRGQRSKQALEQHFQDLDARLKPPSMIGELKLSAARAAVWAPVALGVGIALLKIGQKFYFRPV